MCFPKAFLYILSLSLPNPHALNTINLHLPVCFYVFYHSLPLFFSNPPHHVHGFFLASWSLQMLQIKHTNLNMGR